jgi:hypothetical protein
LVFVLTRRGILKVDERRTWGLRGEKGCWESAWGGVVGVGGTCDAEEGMSSVDVFLEAVMVMEERDPDLGLYRW